MCSHPISYEQLIKYAADELRGSEAAAVAAHIAGCGECRATVSRYHAMRTAMNSIQSTPPPPVTLARAQALFANRQLPIQPIPSELPMFRHLVARLVFDSRSETMLTGVRGAGNSYHVLFESEVAEVDLQIEPLEEQEGTGWQILGQVGLDEPPSRSPVALVPSGATLPVVEVDADERGLFTLRAKEGRYDLLIHLVSALLIVPELEIR